MAGTPREVGDEGPGHEQGLGLADASQGPPGLRGGGTSLASPYAMPTYSHPESSRERFEAFCRSSAELDRLRHEACLALGLPPHYWAALPGRSAELRAAEARYEATYTSWRLSLAR